MLVRVDIRSLILQGRTEMVSTCYRSETSSLGSEEEHDKESYDPEEEAELSNGEAENQNKMEAPDVIEMEREDGDVVKGVIDYAAGLMSAASSWWSSASGSADERQFGDSGNN